MGSNEIASGIFDVGGQRCSYEVLSDRARCGCKMQPMEGESNSVHDFLRAPVHGQSAHISSFKMCKSTKVQSLRSTREQRLVFCSDRREDHKAIKLHQILHSDMSKNK